MTHYHSCPECYEPVPCELACTLDCDMFDADKPLRSFGAHCVCDRCAGVGDNLYTAEWFARYNGFKK